LGFDVEQGVVDESAARNINELVDYDLLWIAIG
jgi:hypothetical protein